MRILLLWLGLFLSFGIQADEAAIGYVKTVSGEATVTTGPTVFVAQPGLPIFLGSRLRTGPQGSIGVTLRDETLLACGPDTDLTLDEFLYRPSEGKLALMTHLIKGSLDYLSGVIARLKPEAVAVKTPTGTIGIRGTHFVVKVDPEDQP